MNSIWNKNLSLFLKRFPVLAQNLGFSSAADAFPADFPMPFEILPSKQRSSFSDGFLPTAKENGKFLHSAYNPLREADTAAQNARKSKSETYGCAFFGAGLGYTVLSYARQFPDDTIILVEWNPAHFLAALNLVDWSAFFEAKNVVLALNTSPDTVISIIEKSGGFNHIAVSENKAQTEHAADYFAALHSLIERNIKKAQINNTTLEKFSNLWLRNSCRNLSKLAELDGLNLYENKLSEDLPVLILAAGPTLEQVLPHLEELKKKTVIVAVDTALRACLKAKVEPDFIVLADPQYYAWRHIAGLSSPSSVLLTESAAYPAVFRFNCRKIIMSSPLFPLGQYIESKIGKKGALSAGGSVSTTAWDFARTIGAKKIIFAGLDLGYPFLQTHIRGSTFEEKVHATSDRIRTSEKSGIAALFGANVEKSEDYDGNEILTDNRMKMFAWWFESKQEEFSKDGIHTFVLSKKSLKIPGFKVMELEELLESCDIQPQKAEFFSKSEDNSTEKNPQKAVAAARNFKKVMEELQEGLESLYAAAKKGASVADEAFSDTKNRSQKFMQKLEQIDSQILNSQFKDIASLVFPTEKQLEKIFSDKVFSENKVLQNFQRSKIIYTQLMKSVRNYQTKLFE